MEFCSILLVTILNSFQIESDFCGTPAYISTGFLPLIPNQKCNLKHKMQNENGSWFLLSCFFGLKVLDLFSFCFVFVFSLGLYKRMPICRLSKRNKNIHIACMFLCLFVGCFCFMFFVFCFM